jgi:hypothetical protein
VTLENEEGYQRAVNFNEIAKRASTEETQSLPIFLKDVKPIHIKPANEPSDIIWENRMLTKKKRRLRKLVVGLVMSVALLGSFVLIF